MKIKRDVIKKESIINKGYIIYACMENGKRVKTCYTKRDADIWEQGFLEYYEERGRAWW